jgi:hypothetical protein
VPEDVPVEEGIATPGSKVEKCVVCAERWVASTTVVGKAVKEPDPTAAV